MYTTEQEFRLIAIKAQAEALDHRDVVNWLIELQKQIYIKENMLNDLVEDGILS